MDNSVGLGVKKKHRLGGCSFGICHRTPHAMWVTCSELPMPCFLHPFPATDVGWLYRHGTGPEQVLAGTSCCTTWQRNNRSNFPDSIRRDSMNVERRSVVTDAGWPTPRTLRM